MGVPGLLYASVNPEYLNSNEGNFDDPVTHNGQVLLVYSNLQYTTSIKQPRFGNLSKFLPIVLMKISSPDSDLAPKH